MSLHQALARHGYGSRPHSYRGREVYRLSDGKIIGVMDACEAWTFLSTIATP